MVTRLGLVVTGVVLGIALVLVGNLLFVEIPNYIPFGRQTVDPACWVLTDSLPLGGGTPGPGIPEGTEFVWDGEVAWFEAIAETGFEPCADPRFSSLVPNPSTLASGPTP